MSDVYNGVTVSDDYRWLENWDDPQVKQWTVAENRRTREYLDGLASRSAIKSRFKQLIGGGSGRYYDLQYRGGILFAMKDQPPKQQPILVTLRSADDPGSERIVVDPNILSRAGSTAIDFYTPSLDGKRVAVSLSQNGSEDGSAHVFDVPTGRELKDNVPRVNFATAGGSIAWKGDGSGFYYTRYPQGKERPASDANFYQQVYFHRLGADSRRDLYVLGKDFPRIAEIQLRLSQNGHWLLASVANGDGGQFAHYLMDSFGNWTQVTQFEDGIVSAALGDDALYLLSRKDAPRGQVLRLSIAQAQLENAETIIPQSVTDELDANGASSIQTMVATPSRLYVVDVVGGPSRVRIFDHNGRAFGTITLPGISAVSGMLSSGNDDVLFRVSTYLEPPAVYRFDAVNNKVLRTAMAETSPANFDDAEVAREFAISKDGTRVPLTIVYRKGVKLDGNNPALLEGYGGFNISMSPQFMGSYGRMWLDQGGVYAIANLRGGGEYGEEWHLAGNLTHKQNVFDDFLACANLLIERKYTTPAHLAIIGGSNGGLLMGAALTQRPDLFRAVVSYVGIYDMLRNELDPNGTFNITEYGTVKDPEQFQALYAYSPYHHVKDGTAYPSILFLTGENDHRVNPFNSRKMIARLQAANSSKNPVLLRTTSSAGHGIGTALDEEIEESADAFSFLLDQLGIKYTAPAGK